MANKIIHQFSDKTITIPYEGGKINGEATKQVGQEITIFNFKDNKFLPGDMSYQGYEFKNNNLIIDGSTIEQEKDGSWLLADINEFLTIDISTLDLMKKQIQFPKDGIYQDSLRWMDLENGKLKENKFIQKIDNERFVFRIEGDKVTHCEYSKLQNGYCSKRKMYFTYDSERYLIKYKKMKYPPNGKFQDETRWINFKDGKISMEGRTYYSFIEKTNSNEWYFKIDDNKILKAGVGFTRMEQVQEDGSCPKLGKKFTLDLDDFQVKMEELPEKRKYPLHREFEDETRWINFRDGKISMFNFTLYSFRQDIDGNKWYFEIDNNKILKAGTDYYKMKQVQEDGSCLELRKKFTLDLDDFQVKMEDLPEKRKYPLNGEFRDETRWINFKDGKISMKYLGCYSMSQIINGNEWYFKIDDNKILGASRIILDMKQVQEDGSCPKLKKKFTLDLNNFRIKMEDLPEKRKYPLNGEFKDDTRWINFKDGKISMEDKCCYSMSQIINGEKWFFKIDNNKILEAGVFLHKMKQVQEDGSCPELKKKFILDLNDFQIKMEDLPEKRKYPLNGKFEDNIRWINFKDGKISMEDNCCYSMIQIINGDNWYFKIIDNKIMKAGTNYLKGLEQVQEDGSCPKLGKKFTLDLDDFQVKMEDLPEKRKYPLYGEFKDDTRWINFKDGKISMEDKRCYSMSQIINGEKWFFKINNNKILEAGNFVLEMKQVQEDGSCPELKKKFTLDLDDFQVKMEDLPEKRKYPLNGLFEDETRWISFKDGKISMEGKCYYSMTQIINDDKWRFKIDNNKILKAGADYNKMKQVQEDGSCPELKKKFTLDLDDFQIKIEDLLEETKTIKEITKKGHILYFFTNGLVTKKEYYKDDKLRKIKFK